MFNGKPTTIIAALLPVLLAGCGGTPDAQADGAQFSPAEQVATAEGPRAGEPTLAEIRAATERFQDVEIALAEGYIPDPLGQCVTAEMEGHPASAGAMGIHYLRPDLLGIAGPPDGRVSGAGAHTDFLEPAVLVYEPQAGGELELVAVENLVFAEAWAAAGAQGPPSFNGVEYEHMVDDPATDFDEAHGFAPHYDRHIWLYRENPLGIFHPMNPNVSCEHMPPATASAAP